MDVNNYFELSEMEKKETLLEVIWNVVERLVREDGWDITNFQEAYDRVKSLNFVNQWMWKKRAIYSIDKQYKANILCNVDFDGFTLILKIFNKKSLLICERVIYNQNPLNAFSYFKPLGVLEWTSDNELVLTSQDEKNKILIDVSDVI